MPASQQVGAFSSRAVLARRRPNAHRHRQSLIHIHIMLLLMLAVSRQPTHPPDGQCALVYRLCRGRFNVRCRSCRFVSRACARPVHNPIKYRLGVVANGGRGHHRDHHLYLVLVHSLHPAVLTSQSAGAHNSPQNSGCRAGKFWGLGARASKSANCKTMSDVRT